MPVRYSLYLHIPFCLHRCAYCDFNTYAGQDHYRQAYVDALSREARLAAESAGEKLPVHTIFFGGGTPSLLSIAQLEQVMRSLSEVYDWLPGLEATLEANPGTLSRAYLKSLRQLGFNRLSLGAQSAHPDDLRLLERQHSFQEVIQSIAWARQAGFNNLNLDLIFGIPFQSFERWKTTLMDALGLQPEHLSLYALTLEHGTPFQRWTERGLIPEADPDLAADMYEYAEDCLSAAGYTHYEISNWARSDEQGQLLKCRHNMQYWRNQPYIGLGAGAHGYAAGVRTANVLGIPTYIDRMDTGSRQAFPVTPATVSTTPVSRRDEMQETMMVGLRLTEEGVSAADFKQRFGEPLPSVFGEPIDRLARQGLLEWAGPDGDRLRLTRRGHLLGNRVFIEFVG